MTQQIAELPRPLLFALVGVLAAGALLFVTRRGGEEEVVAPAPPAAETQAGAGAQTQAGKPESPPAAQPSTEPRTLPSRVERALEEHKVVALLFYNPDSPEDLNVRGAVRDIPTRNGKVVTVTDTLDNVARYTRVTGSRPVTQTPTFLVVDPQGRGRTVTGFQDEATLEQLVVDALG